MTHRDSSHERLCQIVEEQERRIAEQQSELDRLRAIVEIARKATEPSVKVYIRHPHFLDLVKILWGANESFEKARHS